jgi:diguanylate cyclase (GGDEF)-like protein/PAS domain S-box-containing protein
MGAKIPPLDEVLDLIPDAVCIVDADGRFLLVNSGFERILGYKPETVIGRKAFELLHPEDLDATLKQVALIMGGEIQRHFRNRYLHQDGHLVDMQWSAKWHPDHGVRVAVGHEVTELCTAERHVEHRANHDPLTELPNRHQLQRELARAAEHAQASGEGLAVLYIDMDGFKVVNDQFGHAAGDKLLREVSERLKQVTRKGDTAARVGGDEFVMLMPGCSDINAARKLGEIIRAKLRDPYETPGGPISLDASVGIAICEGDACDAAALLAEADRDMYSIKRTRC